MSSFHVQNSFSSRSWAMHEACDREVLGLAQALGEPEIIARLLVTRGISLQDAPAFLSPTLKYFMKDPSLLKHMDRGVERICQALQAGEKIAIWGDYDVDGATSTALLIHFFRMLGIEALYYIPDRITEGYGPNGPGLLRLREKGVKVVITVDCGTNAFEPFETAAKAGLEIIVVDHHVSEPRLPITHALINPNQLSETDENRQTFGPLAAVGLCFLFAIAINRALRAQGGYPEVDLLGLIDLVALGTVCDVVPLRGLNRAFVTQGLKILKQRRNCGLRTLGDIAGLSQAPTVYHLGFILGPRINAGGRIGQADLGTKLLITENELEAQRLAHLLDGFNTERKEIEELVFQEALTQLSDSLPSIIVVSGENWHPGVIGVVAGRLKERLQRPVCVIGFEDGIGKASGRSISGLDLGSLVHAAKQQGFLVAGGGHAMAAGFTVEQDKLSSLKDFFYQRIGTLESALRHASALKIDGALTLRSVTPELIKKLERVGPYGSGHPTPRFALTNVEVSYSKIIADKHIRVGLRQLDGTRLDGIAFRAKDSPLGDGLIQSQGQKIHIAGTLQLDTWQGQERVQLFIDDASKV